MRKLPVILGVYEGHTASAAIMVDGCIVAAVSEERLSRLKVDAGFPRRSIEFCLRKAGLDASAIDEVALVTETYGANDIADVMFKREATYSVQDWIDENRLYWGPRLLENRRDIPNFFEIMGGWNRVQPHDFDFKGLSFDEPEEVISAKFNIIRKKAFETHFGIPPEKIGFHAHYPCHPYYAYYGGPMRGKDVAAVHAEGSGGEYNAAVYRVGDDGLEFVAGTDECDIGRLYQWTTMLLGMKPGQHEYKVMGLAPYATDREVEKSWPVFRDLFVAEDLLVKYRNRPGDLYFHFRKALEGHRFDGIAGALQKMTEEVLSAWVGNVLRKLGCHRLAYGGGVAQNIKANQTMLRLPELHDLFVPASPGDETNCMGVCYLAMEQYCREKKIPLDEIRPLSTIYLGSSYSHAEVVTAIQAAGLGEEFDIRENAGADDIAATLYSGRVVARLAGPMEFGTRALGNRSILADPSRPGIVHKINAQIKYRDFWMPFSPTVLDRSADRYLVNPKRVASPYMTIAFDTTPAGRKDLPAALHPSDHTARPQILRREDNPGYYELIESFENLSGIGALLNTSFNLHGHPIVCAPADAIHTLLHSDLDALLLEDVLVSRRNPVDLG